MHSYRASVGGQTKFISAEDYAGLMEKIQLAFGLKQGTFSISLNVGGEVSQITNSTEYKDTWNYAQSKELDDPTLEITVTAPQEEEKKEVPQNDDEGVVNISLNDNLYRNRFADVDSWSKLRAVAAERCALD